MKRRVTLTIDPLVVKKAKRIAHAKRTSVSFLVEDLIRRTPMPAKEPRKSFVDQWAGKLRIRKSVKPDARLQALKERYGLPEDK